MAKKKKGKKKSKKGKKSKKKDEKDKKKKDTKKKGKDTKKKGSKKKGKKKDKKKKSGKKKDTKSGKKKGKKKDKGKKKGSKKGKKKDKKKGKKKGKKKDKGKKGKKKEDKKKEKKEEEGKEEEAAEEKTERPGMPSIEVGTQAPDFELPDHTGEKFTLSAHKGKPVLLSFHPLAWTEVCANQMKALEGKQKELQKANCVGVGISVDPVPTKKEWADSLNIKETPLLSDFWPHGDVATSYGMFDIIDGVSERAVIILDKDQKVVFVKQYERATEPDMDYIMKYIGNMS